MKISVVGTYFELSFNSYLNIPITAFNYVLALLLGLY